MKNERQTELFYQQPASQQHVRSRRRFRTLSRSPENASSWTVATNVSIAACALVFSGPAVLCDSQALPPVTHPQRPSSSFKFDYQETNIQFIYIYFIFIRIQRTERLFACLFPFLLVLLPSPLLHENPNMADVDFLKGERDRR